MRVYRAHSIDWARFCWEVSWISGSLVLLSSCPQTAPAHEFGEKNNHGHKNQNECGDCCQSRINAHDGIDPHLPRQGRKFSTGEEQGHGEFIKRYDECKHECSD